MKFPISKLNLVDYLNKIDNLLRDSECIIFLDTNIFAFFYKIHLNARKDFFLWIEPFIQQGRIKTPVWALNEYTNRFIRNQLSDYISAKKKLSTIQIDFKEVSKFLKMHFDVSTLRQHNYTTNESFNEDLNFIKDKLEKIYKATKNTDNDFLIDIHESIKSLFEPTVIDTDIFKLLQQVSNEGNSRYKNKIPPGYEDANKDLNSFGDLIIWQEIISYCKRNLSIKKVIVLTIDEKKDWVYAPPYIINETRQIPNITNPFKIADVRLIYEFKEFSGSEELYIINFETLVKCLLKQNHSLLELARAIQVEQLENSEIINNQVTNEEPVSEESVIEEPVSEELAKVIDSIYGFNALADKYFPHDEKSIISILIQELKSYSWYSQNPAIESFLAMANEEIFEEDDYNDKIFVLGRNIYQAACGGSLMATKFLENIKLNLKRYDKKIAIHLLNGMFYEVYFNSLNEFRNLRYFKTQFLENLFDLQTSKHYTDSIEFINSALQPYLSLLLIIPSQFLNIVKITIHSVHEIQTNNIGIGTKLVYEVKSLVADKKELLEDCEVDIFGLSEINGGINAVSSAIFRTYACPQKQMNFIFDPLESEHAFFIIPTNKTLGVPKLIQS